MKILIFITLLIYASLGKADPTWANSPAGSKEKYLYYAQEYVRDGGPSFTCGGIMFFDAGAAMDRPVYYAEANTRKILCYSSMIGDASVDSKDTCPPKAWANSGCEDQYREQLTKMRKSAK